MQFLKSYIFLLFIDFIAKKEALIQVKIEVILQT